MSFGRRVIFYTFIFIQLLSLTTFGLYMETWQQSILENYIVRNEALEIQKTEEPMQQETSEEGQEQEVLMDSWMSLKEDKFIYPEKSFFADYKGGKIIYYSQTDFQWAKKPYGQYGTVSTHGCGPTIMAMVISSLTEHIIFPDEMAQWAVNNNQCVEGQGSKHSIIPETARHYGLTPKSVSSKKETVIEELNKGNIVVVLLGEGTFSKNSGHFILIHSYHEDGSVSILDPNSIHNSKVLWNLDDILKEVKYSATDGGPIWSISSM